MMPLFRSRRLPLAWLNLTHDPLRLLTSLSGIVFSVILMFMEFGFWNALMDSTAELVRKLDADDNDLIMISASKHTLAAKAWFSLRRLYEARQFSAVEAAYPISIEARASIWRNPVSGRARKIRVLAFNPDEPVFRPDVVSRASAEALKRPDTALIDVLSKPVYGRPEAGVAAVLSRRPIRIVGTFRLGTDFVTDGNLIMSDQNYLRYVPDRRLDPPDLRDVDLGLLKVVPGADLPALVAALRRALPGDVAFSTRDELIDKEQRFWMSHTPVGTIFGFGMAMGFVVGAVICYQVLSSDIRAQLPEYATLKAMGYGDHYFTKVVLHEALILALLGFVLGLLASLLLDAGLVWGTGLLMELTPGRAGLVLALTVGMCTLSGCVAIRKLLSADPVELFK
jgi:putative ABC transport system permease protein